MVEALSGERLAAVRSQLEAEITQLREQIDQLERDFLDESWKEPRSDDDAETGSVTSERERMMSLTRNAKAMLAEVQQAVQRIDAGTYGRCAACGQPIHPDRLEAIPQTRHCLECRRKAERFGR